MADAEGTQTLVLAGDFSKIVFESDGQRELPHLGKDKDGVSDSKIGKKEVSKGRLLRSSTRAPSRPSRPDL